MHTGKQEIFDKYAKEQGYDDMDDLIIQFKYSGFSLKVMKRYMFSACDLVQAEQQKRIAENARIKIVYSAKDEFIYSSMELGPIVDKESITNPENLIK